MRTRISIGCLALCIAGSGTAHASEADCTVILDAIVKLSTTPVRTKVSVLMPGGKPPFQSEIIRIKDKTYVHVTGEWVTQPYDSEKTAANAHQAMATTEHTCSRDGSEPVDGQPADVYRMESTTPKGKSQAKNWISPASGLPLREHTILIEGAIAKGEYDVHFDYTNVTPPPGVK